MSEHILDKFFKPKSIAIVGASSKENSIGRILLENLKQSGFPGEIYPINPNYAEILGVPSFPSVTSLQTSIDLAIIAVSIQGVQKIMEECGQAKIPGAIIISAGGKEVGEKGKEIEANIHARARTAGIRYLGPNCMGILCPPTRLNASFAAHSVKPGSVALLSQSGIKALKKLSVSLRLIERVFM